MEKRLKKKGTLDLNMMEASPAVFRNRLYRLEYVHDFYHGNLSGEPYFRCVEVETGVITPPFGHGFAFGSLFVMNDRAYMTCVRSPVGTETWSSDTIYLLTSDDLIHWSEPAAILHDPRWCAFNTSICQADDRYLMVFELNKPEELVGVPFTMFFAESTDLVHWRVIDGACFGKEFYTGAPLLRYHGGFAYFFYLHRDDTREIWETWVVRSRDLKQWDFAPGNPVLTPDAADKVCASGVKFRPEVFKERIAEGCDINNSDIDMCEWRGKLYITYSWGNQYYKDNLAWAEFDGTEREFCESFWKNSGK